VTGHLADFNRGSELPLYVVTAQHESDRAGCVVGFVTQCSIYPERLVACLSIVNHTFEIASQSGALCVHLLSATDVELAHRFGERTGDVVDKFDGLEVKRTRHGAPLLPGDHHWVAGPICDVHSFGDHVGFVIEPEESGGRLVDEPLTTGSIHLDAAHPPEQAHTGVEGT